MERKIFKTFKNKYIKEDFGEVLENSQDKVYYQQFNTVYKRASSIVVTFKRLQHKYKGFFTVESDIQYNPLEEFKETITEKGDYKISIEHEDKVIEWLEDNNFVVVKEPIHDYECNLDIIKKLKFKDKDKFIAAVELWKDYTG
jgi:hypothetical protein